MENCDTCVHDRSHSPLCNTCEPNSKLSNYEESFDAEEIKKLRHFKDTAIGLWCTDRPDKIPENLKEKYFFELKFNPPSAKE